MSLLQVPSAEHCVTSALAGGAAGTQRGAYEHRRWVERARALSTPWPGWQDPVAQEHLARQQADSKDSCCQPINYSETSVLLHAIRSQT